VHSVAEGFALIAGGGELAIAYGVVPWVRGEALRAVGACFKCWLSTRGGTGAGEDIRALDQVRAFIDLHGSSRFELVDDYAPTDQRIINRAGFRRRENGEWEYLILPTVWRNEVCAGSDHMRAAEALSRYDLLVPGKDRPWQNVRRCGTHGAVRGYCVRGRILGAVDVSDALRELSD
jgi:uncharacterized protein (DUF927 family)